MKKMLPLTLIAVAGGLFAFWYFQIRQESGQQNSSQNAQTPSPTPPIQNNSPEQQPAQQNYFVISEWGVKFPIEKLYADDIEYVIFSHSPTVNFGSKSASQFSSECGSKNDMDIGINIGLHKTVSDKKIVYSTNMKQLGGYYYHTMEPRMTGCDLEDKIPDEVDTFTTALYDAIKEGLKNLELAQ